MTAPRPLLLPQPRHIALTGDTFRLNERHLIVLDDVDPQRLRPAATRIRATLEAKAELRCEVVAGAAAFYPDRGITMTVMPGAAREPQGYELTITPVGIHAVASSAAGAYYAATTLCQLVRQYGSELPTLTISDWPDFPVRGVMLDVSRDKVPTMATIFELVDLLASWKVNQLQLYTEHAFAYRHHPTVWADASPITGDEILALDAYCRERFIELVPNQNSFGHMRRWLFHDRYRSLAEVPSGGFESGWVAFDEPFSLCPIDPGSIELVRSLYDELLPHFTSRSFNVGCDETIDLGLGRSREAVEERGRARVYLEFLQQIYREVKARGRMMQFWGDIITQHPDLVPELPHDAIALNWGYDAEHAFDRDCALFAKAGLPFYVCPGTSTWNAIAGRTRNALGNLRNAAKHGLDHGALGYLNTDWGDYGHWQPLPVSYLGFAYGAAVSWTYEANRAEPIVPALDMHGFSDAAGVMGQLACDLGQIDEETGAARRDVSLLFAILQMPASQLVEIWHGRDVPFPARVVKDRLLAMPDWVDALRKVTASGLDQALGRLDELMARLPDARMERPDADLIGREYAWAGNMLRHACRRACWVMGIARPGRGADQAAALAEEADALIAEYQSIWLARNRPGGLRESLARMDAMRRDYG